MNNDNLDLDKYQIRTDLAVENHEIVADQRGGEIPGITLDKQDFGDIHMTKLSITSEEGSKALNKPIGNYLTFESQNLKSHDTEIQERVTHIFAREFNKYLNENLKLSKDARVLVIGLGNWNVTPDALGPMVVENILITRHLFELMPDKVSEGFRPVSGIAPGVLGITGIETSEIVQGIVDKSLPDLVIAIDALASRSLERIYTTIQIADTGIHPGSGIGNQRKILNKESLGVPVVAIGVPTVVDAVSITSDTIDFILKHLSEQMEIRNPFGSSNNSNENSKNLFGLIGGLQEQEKRQLIHEVLAPLGYNLMVTPKEVDAFIEDTANIIANGLNMALHHGIDQENVGAYTH